MRAASTSSRAFVEATIRPSGCSMIDDTAGTRADDEAAAVPSSFPSEDGCARAVASATRTPAQARSAARKAATGPSPSAVRRSGASPDSAPRSTLGSLAREPGATLEEGRSAEAAARRDAAHSAA